MKQPSLFGDADVPPRLSVDGWRGHARFSPCKKYRYELHREDHRAAWEEVIR